MGDVGLSVELIEDRPSHGAVGIVVAVRLGFWARARTVSCLSLAWMVPGLFHRGIVRAANGIAAIATSTLCLIRPSPVASSFLAT